LALQSKAAQVKYGPFPLRIPLRRAYLEERGKNMKKLLLATSILAGTASIAAAEITLSGDARMGFLNEFFGASDDDTTFTSRARVAFTFSGETDGGLSFGASFRADNSSTAAKGESGSVFLSGAFGKISMGDVDGAAQAAVGQVDGVGLTGLGDRNELTYLANGGLDDDDVTDFDVVTADTLTGDPSVLYEYSTGGLGLFVSVTNPGHDTSINTTDADGIAWAVGANYGTDAFKVSIGWEDLQADQIGGPAGFDADHLVLGGDATFGAFTAKVRWGSGELDAFDGLGGTGEVDLDQWALSGTYAMDAISVTGFYSTKDFDLNFTPANVSLVGVESYGIGASYDLGGGASLVGGWADTSEDYSDGTSGDDTAFDLGVSFKF
jgi:outer membrane protein OmpU